MQSPIACTTHLPTLLRMQKGAASIEEIDGYLASSGACIDCERALLEHCPPQILKLQAPPFEDLKLARRPVVAPVFWMFAIAATLIGILLVLRPSEVGPSGMQVQTVPLPLNVESVPTIAPLPAPPDILPEAGGATPRAGRSPTPAQRAAPPSSDVQSPPLPPAPVALPQPAPQEDLAEDGIVDAEDPSMIGPTARGGPPVLAPEMELLPRIKRGDQRVPEAGLLLPSDTVRFQVVGADEVRLCVRSNDEEPKQLFQGRTGASGYLPTLYAVTTPGRLRFGLAPMDLSCTEAQWLPDRLVGP